MKSLTEEELRMRMEDRVADFGSQAAWARHLGVSKAFVSHVMNGVSQVTEPMLTDMGLCRISVVCVLEVPKSATDN